MQVFAPTAFRYPPQTGKDYPYGKQDIADASLVDTLVTAGLVQRLDAGADPLASTGQVVVTGTAAQAAAFPALVSRDGIRKGLYFAQQTATSNAAAQSVGASFSAPLELPIARFDALRLAAINQRAAPPAAGLKFQVGVVSDVAATPGTWVDVTFSGAVSPTFAGVAVDKKQQERVVSDLIDLASIARTDGGTGCIVVVKTIQQNSVAGWSYVDRGGKVRSADVIAYCNQGAVSVAGIGDSIMAGTDAGTPLRGYVEAACALAAVTTGRQHVPEVQGFPGVGAPDYRGQVERVLASVAPSVLVFAPFSPNPPGNSDTSIISRALDVADICARADVRLIIAGPCVTDSYDLSQDTALRATRDKLMAIFSDGRSYLDLYGLLTDGAAPGRFAASTPGFNSYHPGAAGRDNVAAELARLLAL